MSLSRISSESRSDTDTSRRSPTSWPRLSLTALNLSRSMNSIAVTPGLRCRRVIAWWARSISSVRLGSLVSGSCRAWASSHTRSLTSFAEAYQVAPSRRALHSSQRHEPSRWRQRVVKFSTSAGWPLPARIGPSSCSASSGWTNSATGRDCSSSRDQPRRCSQAGFRSVKEPSSEIVASRSLVISNSLRTPASVSGTVAAAAACSLLRLCSIGRDHVGLRERLFPRHGGPVDG